VKREEAKPSLQMAAEAVVGTAVSSIHTDERILRVAEPNIAQQMELQYRNVWYIHYTNSGIIPWKWE
jgi:hypothetical protein